MSNTVTPRMLIGTAGQTTQLTDLTSLQAAEMEAMCRIAKRHNYEPVLAQSETKLLKGRAPKAATNRAVWDGHSHVDAVWIHQQGGNYQGGPDLCVCEAIDQLARGLAMADKAYRLVLDNNTTMRHKSVARLGGRTECPSFALLGAEIDRKVAEGKWYEVGYAACADPEAGLPFIECGISAEQLLLTAEIKGLLTDKTVDFCYIGTSRANAKKQKARLDLLGDFLDHECAHYSGSLFKKKCGFVKGWQLMGEAKAHLIVREPTMRQVPLHRYLQALVHGAVPVVLGEPEAVPFIHNDELNTILRVSSLAEGLDLVARREELLPLLAAEGAYWLDFDLNRGPGFNL